MRRGYTFITRLLLLGLLALTSGTAARAQTGGQTIYDDALQNAWQDYSWATVNFANASPVHGGKDSIRVDAGGYTALYFHHAAQSAGNFANVTFWINGGPTGGQKLRVQAVLGGNALNGSYQIPPPQANTWVQVSVPLASLGATGNFDGIWIQDTSGNTEPTFYVDDVSLGLPPPNQPVTVSVDAGANLHPISPLVYGVAFGSSAQLADLNSPLNRWGGNAVTRYNWQTNATNRASDYFFESLPGGSSTPGGDADGFISGNVAAGAQTMMTIPTIGWVAKLGANNSATWSFSVNKYGAQTATAGNYPDAGSGIKPDGSFVTGNDPHDANQTADANFQGSWVSHLLGQWGTATNGGVKYYLMDNEPSIWFGTHRDVHPTGPGMEEIRNDIETYGAKVKSLDPSALVVGPEEWGWDGYLYSGADQQVAASLGYNPANYPDRKAHGGMDYIPWLLGQLQQYDAANHQRLLDVLSVHFYPQGDAQGDQEFGDNTSVATQLLRNRSTRNLWDPSYTAENYIGQPVRLVPLLKSWVSQYYPGTKTALTEYSWGADGHINGATAQADVLGILGREGVDMATRWTAPATSSPVYNAIKLYRNYDGSKSAFGDTSVSASAPSPDNLSSFAALRSSDGALTVMVVNKVLSGGDTPLTLSLANFKAGATAQAWQLTSANTITRLADVAVTNGSITATLPMQSITLFVVPAAVVAQPPTVAVAASANPNPVVGTTTALSVLGADAGGESGLTYTWAATGTPPAPVTFSANGTNAAKNTTATFTASGTYTFQVTITNGAGLSTTSSVSVPVTVTRAISGVVTLQGVGVGNRGQAMTFTFTPTAGGAAFTRTATLNATDGSFSLTDVPAGAYTLGVKGSKWLRRDITVDTTSAAVTNANATLLGGDATNDNKVNASDFLALHDAYFSASGDATGRYKAAADFNCDGKVNAQDFLILHDNYLKSGDK